MFFIIAVEVEDCIVFIVVEVVVVVFVAVVVMFLRAGVVDIEKPEVVLFKTGVVDTGNPKVMLCKLVSIKNKLQILYNL